MSRWFVDSGHEQNRLRGEAEGAASLGRSGPCTFLGGVSKVCNPPFGINEAKIMPGFLASLGMTAPALFPKRVLVGHGVDHGDVRIDFHGLAVENCWLVTPLTYGIER